MDEVKKTRLPTTINKDDDILQWDFVRLSLRQMILIVLGLGAWFAVSRMTSSFLPLSGLFAAMLWFWIPIATLVLALVKRNGRPLEFEIADRVAFAMKPHRFAPVASRDNISARMSVAEAEWEEFDEPYRWEAH